jgi:MOSC domain-containing protein YiiM
MIPGMAHVHQISVNPAGGVPKVSVLFAELTTEGVAGDRQRNLKYHGGPTRAVCLFSLEVILALQAQGHPITPGSTGENLTLAGIDWAALTPGKRVRAGKAVIEITSYANPCRNIARSFADGDSKHICQEKNPGRSRVALHNGTILTRPVVHE